MNVTRVIIGLFIISIGLSSLVDFPFFKFIFAAFVVWLGVKVIMGTGKSGTSVIADKGESGEEVINRVLIFSAINKKFNSNNFRGGQITAVFGGGEADFRGAKVKQKEITLEATAIFGGLKLYVPKNWNVKTEGVGIIGGYDNKTKSTLKPAQEVVVKGAAIFGGVEIVNE